jgi:hypothetical protein
VFRADFSQPSGVECCFLAGSSSELWKLSGIHPVYLCKEGGRVEDGLLLEFPYTPTRTRSV